MLSASVSSGGHESETWGKEDVSFSYSVWSWQLVEEEALTFYVPCCVIWFYVEKKQAYRYFTVHIHIKTCLHIKTFDICAYLFFILSSFSLSSLLFKRSWFLFSCLSTTAFCSKKNIYYIMCTIPLNFWTCCRNDLISWVTPLTGPVFLWFGWSPGEASHQSGRPDDDRCHGDRGKQNTPHKLEASAAGSLRLAWSSCILPERKHSM